jgi:hypothetical protein
MKKDGLESLIMQTLNFRPHRHRRLPLFCLVFTLRVSQFFPAFSGCVELFVVSK